MNKEQILKEIEETKKHLEELERLAKEEDKKNWKPIEGEKYYFLENTLDVSDTICLLANKRDAKRLEFGNCFKTREEAEFEVERRKVIQELKQFAYNFTKEEWNKRGAKYELVYNQGSIVVDSWTGMKYSDIHFRTKEDCEEAIKRVGEERIIKYYFRMGE